MFVGKPQLPTAVSPCATLMDPFPVGDTYSHRSSAVSLTRPLQVGTRVFFLANGKAQTGTVQNTETIEVSSCLALAYVLIAFADVNAGSSICRYKA